MSAKTVLITGCSRGGIGAALAMSFRAKGFHVFATVRDMAKAGPLVDIEGIEILELELTSEESIGICAKAVEKHTGGVLDVLINNAGVDYCRPLLDTPIDDAKKIYDVNVWALLAMSQAFTPMLIKSKGVICNISSIAGKFTFAWGGK
jgi:NAD(P)-dependent dehydrogenase (short-subunit alcohol dehydrogenase family)